MVQKRLLCPQRVRKTPKQFSWVDQRLVRDGHIERLSHRAASLYLFLVTVADARGLSYYSDPSICRRLGMDDGTLQSARRELMRVGGRRFIYNQVDKPSFKPHSMAKLRPRLADWLTLGRGRPRSLPIPQFSYPAPASPNSPKRCAPC